MTAGHLRPESTFYPKVNFQHVVANIPDGAEVLMLFCEIDCREGILVAVAKGRYKVREPVVWARHALTKFSGTWILLLLRRQSVDAGIKQVVSIYMDALRTLITTRRMKVGFELAKTRGRWVRTVHAASPSVCRRF